MTPPTDEDAAPPGLSVANAWLLMAPSAVPEQLAPRAITMSLVLLRAGEVVVTARPPGEGAAVLDERELMLARLAARGMPHAEIAAVMRVSPRTVERWLGQLRNRFGVRSAAELAAVLSQRGLS